MISLRLLIEYHAYPVWIYDEDGEVIDTDLPPEWQEDVPLRQLLDTIQNTYDSLFINNSYEFSYVGFDTLAEKEEFIAMVNEAVKCITKKNAGKYNLRNSIDDTFFSSLSVKAGVNKIASS